MSSDYEFDTHQVAGSGIQIKLISGEAIASRDLVYMGSDGTVYVADASLVGTMPVIGMAMFAVISGGVISILLKGLIGLSTWTWTAGNELYASDTAGEMSASAGTVAQQVGIAFSATQIYIDPQNVDIGGAVGAHVLATTGPHTNTLPLTDLAVAVQGEIVHRSAADWAALGVGAAGLALIAGGAGADVSWAAPDPAAHEGTHVSGGADDIDSALDGRAITLTTQGDIVYASGVNTLARLGAGTDGQILKTGGGAANPSWTWDHQMDSAPDATDTGNGDLDFEIVGENVIPGDVLYLKADGKYWKADADSAAEMPAVVMAMETIAADNSCKMLRHGFFREDSRWNWTVGNGEANLLFVHTTAGDMVQLANQPAGAGDQVQVVGHVVTADVVYFNPSYELVEIAA